MDGVFRPRQSIQRVTPNAGNRRVIAGGVGVGRQDTPLATRTELPPVFNGPLIPTITGKQAVAIVPVATAGRFDYVLGAVFTKTGTAWPAWMLLDAFGVISGTPPAIAATTAHTVTCTTGAGSVASNAFNTNITA